MQVGTHGTVIDLELKATTNTKFRVRSDKIHQMCEYNMQVWSSRQQPHLHQNPEKCVPFDYGQVCEMWWTQGRLGGEHLVPQLIPYMIVRSFEDDAKEADVKRMYG